ncbi:pentapeptide repeat-containing protein [Streptomyces chartreusis]|uniref:pentapeptide repeat-containing protein n=1 Tax=Streptomyces chartreusis TaxID=1969 RepID=UPI00380BCEE5
MTSADASLAGTEWHCCGDGADESDVRGCRGVRVPGFERCLVHLDTDDRQTYFAGLTSGGDVDHRGTHFSESLLDELVAAVTVSSGRAVFRKALFDEAVFDGDVDLSEAIFHGEAAFRRARFKGKALFTRADFRDISSFRKGVFEGSAHFGSVEFAKPARFGEVKFHGHAGFNGAKFGNVARFDSAVFVEVATFTRASFIHNARFDSAEFLSPPRFNDVTFGGEVDFSQVKCNRRITFNGAQFVKEARFRSGEFLSLADFSSASFQGDANFEGARFSGSVHFVKSSFEKLAHFGPVVAGHKIDFSFAVFQSPITFEISSLELVCRRTRFDATVTCRLRYSTVDLAGAVLGDPVSISAGHTAFERSSGGVMVEGFPAGQSEQVSIASLRGVDASHLVLTDVDLTNCRFSGAFNLDKLRIEGRSKFASTPRGIRLRSKVVPFWWTRRNTLAEEHYWRSNSGVDSQGWMRDLSSSGAERPVSSDDLATIYRDLRKSLEDSKDEPGAADFYYGEMEARRKNKGKGSPSERVLLSAYWAISGYGLRAARAFAWLAAMMVAAVVAMMLWGLPGNPPRQVTSGSYAGGDISLSTSLEKPVLKKTTERTTWRRLEQSSRIVANSVAFRSSEQRLTSIGVMVEFICRILGPLLLALSILAIRGRVKR